MKRIVTATDFTKSADNAVYYAADLAKWTNAELVVLHVSPFPIMVNDIAVPFPVEDYDALEQLTVLKAKLTRQTESKVAIITEKLSGAVISQISGYCNNRHTDLLVLGAESRLGLSRIFSGVTFDAIRHLALPLLIVPPEATFAPVRQIGFACDLSVDVHPALLNSIANMVSALGAALSIVHVSEPSSRFSVNEMEEAITMRNRLEYLHPDFGFLSGDEPASAILKEAIEKNWDMLIVIHRNHGLIGNLLHHSQAKQFSIHSTLPLLVFHQS